MKKILLLLLLLCTLLVGCSSDEEYIESVKNIPIQNLLGSSTTEELAANFINKATNSEDVTVLDLKWSVEGKTEKGKMIIAQQGQNKVYFNTARNGDYVEYMPLEVYIITSDNKKITLGEILYNDFMNDFSKAFEF